MNKLIVSASAVAAVTLLSGCQHVTVRHHYPQPVEVIEHRTVVVDHRHKPAPPPVKVIKVVRPPVRVVAPPPKHEHKKPRPGHRDDRNEHRGHERPRVKVIPVAPPVKRAGGFAAQVERKERAAKPVPAKAKQREEKAKQEEKHEKKERREDRKERRHGA